MADYNGWSNRATWNVSLWLNNDEGTYKELQSLAHRASSPEKLAEKIEELCKAIWPDGKTPDGDNLSEADWQEIATSEWDEGQWDGDHDDDLQTPRTGLDQFIAKHGISFESHRVATRPDGLMESDPKKPMRHFRCKVTCTPKLPEGKKYVSLDECSPRSFGVYFSQGSAHIAEPTLADVLDCLASDAYSYEDAKDSVAYNKGKTPGYLKSVFETWADELGFDVDSRKAEKTFRAVKRQAEQLKRTLGAEAFDELVHKVERQ